MEKHLLSKSTFIRGNQCLKSLYLNKYRPFLRDKLSPEQLAKFRRGHQVGEVAQLLFPGGINLKPKSPSLFQKAVMQTNQIIESGKYDIIYEPGFTFDRLLVFLDILVRENNSWYGFEVKSSRKISDTFLLDAAFQYYVISNSGIKLADFSIIYAGEDLDYENLETDRPIEELFITESVLEKIIPMQEIVSEQVIRQKATLQLTKSPEIGTGPHCFNPYPCDFYGHCSGIESRQ
jgi:hypothetical protein